MLSPRWAAPLLAVAFALLPGWCAAQESSVEPIVTDRPDFTESVETVPARRVQLETGYTFARAGREKDHALGELLLRVATGPRAELRLGINSYGWTRGPGGNASGFEDASLGFKVRLSDGSGRLGLGRPAISLIGATSLPTGSRAYRERNFQPEAKLCLGWDLSERLALSSNLNYAYASEDGKRFGQFSGSVSFGFGLTERLGSYLEYFGFSPGGRGGPSTNYLNGGLTYLVTNDYQLDVRAGVGLNGAGADNFVGIGAARRW